MFIRTLATIALTATLSWSATSSAGTVGTLSWDGKSDFIVDTASPTTRYLQFGSFKGLTSSEIEAKTATGGVWSGFHLATLSESYSFFNKISVDTIVDTLSTRDPVHKSTVDGTWTDGLLGESWSSTGDNIVFASGVEGVKYGSMYLTNAGIMSFTETSSWNDLKIDRRKDVDYLGRLMISDSNVSAVPVPAAAFLFAPALLGFLGLRRKARA